MESIFYFAELCDKLSAISIIIGVLFAVCSVVCCGLYIAEGEDYLKRYGIRTSIPALIFMIVAAVIPSKETYIFMKAGKCIDDAVVSNPEVKKLPENAILLLNEYIKRELKEKEE